MKESIAKRAWEVNNKKIAKRACGMRNELCRISGKPRLTTWIWFEGFEAQGRVKSRCKASQVEVAVKNSPVNAGDVRDAGLIPGPGRSPGGGHGDPPQYSCLENPTYRGAWQPPPVHRVAKSQIWLNWLSPLHTQTQTHAGIVNRYIQSEMWLLRGYMLGTGLGGQCGKFCGNMTKRWSAQCVRETERAAGSIW